MSKLLSKELAIIKATLFVLIMILVMGTASFMCVSEEVEIEYVYEGEFRVATQIDLGDPLFYKIDKYYVYSNVLGLEENALFEPISLNKYLIGVFVHDSLSHNDDMFTKIKFESKEFVPSGIVFASGKNRFNNTRFSAGEKFLVRVVE